MTKPAKPLRGRAARLARLMPSGPATAARTPFVLLVVVLLGGGLITLLLLNSALNQGSFQLSRLKKQTTDLTDEQQALQRDVDAYSAPDALERRARELGLVPGGGPVFLEPDGKVRGLAGKVKAARSPASASESPTASPLASPPASPSAAPSATASVTAGPDTTPATPAAAAPSPAPPVTPLVIPSASASAFPLSGATPSTSAQPTPDPGR